MSDTILLLCTCLRWAAALFPHDRPPLGETHDAHIVTLPPAVDPGDGPSRAQDDCETNEVGVLPGPRFLPLHQGDRLAATLKLTGWFSKSYLNTPRNARKTLFNVARHGDGFDGVDVEAEIAFLRAKETVASISYKVGD